MRLAIACLAACLVTTAPVSAQSPGNGQLSVSYDPGADSRSNQIANSLRELAVFDALGQSVNESVHLPRNLFATFRNCGLANAFYDPQKLEIVMCYELIARVGDAARQWSDDDQEVGENIVGATSFFFLHELGHALVDQLDLPTTGREEDAVDEIATLILLDGDAEGVKMLSSAVQQFDDLAAQKQAVKDLAFWDEHPVDAQRMYNIMCLVYGSNPQAFKDMIGEGGLPEQRAKGCPAEFTKKKRSWTRLLGPSLKPE